MDALYPTELSHLGQLTLVLERTYKSYMCYGGWSYNSGHADICHTTVYTTARKPDARIFHRRESYYSGLPFYRCVYHRSRTHFSPLLCRRSSWSTLPLFRLDTPIRTPFPNLVLLIRTTILWLTARGSSGSHQKDDRSCDSTPWNLVVKLVEERVRNQPSKNRDGDCCFGHLHAYDQAPSFDRFGN